MTLDEVQNEIVRLNNIKRQLVEEALKSYGIHVVDSPALIGEEIQKILG